MDKIKEIWALIVSYWTTHELMKIVKSNMKIKKRKNASLIKRKMLRTLHFLRTILTYRAKTPEPLIEIAKRASKLTYNKIKGISLNKLIPKISLMRDKATWICQKKTRAIHHYSLKRTHSILTETVQMPMMIVLKRRKEKNRIQSKWMDSFKWCQRISYSKMWKKAKAWNRNWMNREAS